MAIPVVRCGALHRFNDLRQSASEGPEGIAEGHVFSFGEQPLGGLVFSLHEFAERPVVLLNYVVEIVDSAHRSAPSDLRTEAKAKAVAAGPITEPRSGQ